jgi:hypothetical protein
MTNTCQVTLRFQAHEHCEFIKKKKRKEETPTYVTETKIGMLPSISKGSKVGFSFPPTHR